MKTIATSALLVVLLFIGCSKENNHQQLHSFSQDNSTRPVDSIPINDLGTGTFNGYTGGLYPDGSNTASGTYANDLLAASQSIVPLDTFGNPSTKIQGRILFISIGASTGANMMIALKAKTTGNSLTNPRLHLMNCNQAAQKASLNSILDPHDPYWDHVKQVIQGNKGSYKQVQIVYLETDDSTLKVSFPTRPLIVKNDIEACMRTMKKKFPNMKVLYVLARTRVFGNNTPWNGEPSPYYFGWACKWAIEDQINGVTGTEYKGKNAVAPMIAWGFYEWAWTTPRKTDGFYWLESETKDDLHANTAGEDTLSNRFQNFLLTDPYASTWYAAH